MQRTLQINTQRRGFTDITERCARLVDASNIQTGLCNLFVHHTSASLFINENADPDVRHDLEAWMSRLVQDGDPLFRHTDEGPDDMSAHIRSVLTATSITVPITNQRLALGTWQSIYLWEHRTSSHTRNVTVSIVATGEGHSA